MLRPLIVSLNQRTQQADVPTNIEHPVLESRQIMKTKPMWGLWLLMIVTPVAVFSSVSWWKNLPPRLHTRLVTPTTSLSDNMSLQGAEKLTLPYFTKAHRISSSLNKDTYSVSWQMPSKTEEFVFSFWIKSGASDCLSTSPDEHIFSHQGNGPSKASLHFGLKKLRKQNVSLKLNWKLNEKHGVKYIVIAPQN